MADADFRISRLWLIALVTTLHFLTAASSAFSQAVIHGRVTSNGVGIPLASVRLVGTSIGSAADLEGHYRITSVPAGRTDVIASAVGFEAQTRRLDVVDGDVTRLDFELPEKVMRTGDVVVSATRTEQVRQEVPVIVSVLDNRLFESAQAVSLSEGLSFQPGLRLEIDCQTCNYSQVRMNGLSGSYSQILIDSRPIFSPLNGLYGLDQIPTSMIDRVEVIRGGGSALFGASAVAGTINIITREPDGNGSNLLFQQGAIGDGTPDRTLSVNSSMLNEKETAGLFLFGLLRNRQPYDHDSDGFSEIPYVRNNSFGLRGFHRPGQQARITLEFHSLTEERQGGNRIGEAPHLADQGEYRLHRVIGGGLTYEQYLPGGTNRVSVYASGQHTGRDHYTGIDHVDAYGDTESLTLVGGVQYTHTLGPFLGTPLNTFTLGVETALDQVNDEIPFYDRFLDQTTRQAGFYGQSDWKIGERLTVLTGVRLDLHSNLGAPAVNPRANVLLDLSKEIQWRGSYGTGFRAPQAFDADLHIAFAGGGISRIELHDNLRAETSRSFSTSLDFNRSYGSWMYGLTIEAFHTRLQDTFVLEEIGQDSQGNLLLERRNGGASTVAGFTGELRYVWADHLEIQSGLTLQQSRYDRPVKWSADLPGSTHYLRTPNLYGFYVLTARPLEPLDISFTGVLTGPMSVPHLAGYIDRDVLERSPLFLESNVKFGYTANRAEAPGFQLFAGIQNLTNAYQNDFDKGPRRDSNYVYGPARPRTFYIGLGVQL